jgi:hypothetical protein
MKICAKASAVLPALLLFASGRAASYADRIEPINWREYNDC